MEGKHRETPSGVQWVFIEQLPSIVDSLLEESDMCNYVIIMLAWYKTESVERMLAEREKQTKTTQNQTKTQCQSSSNCAQSLFLTNNTYIY